MFFETIGIIICVAGAIQAHKGTTSLSAKIGMFSLIGFVLYLLVF